MDDNQCIPLLNIICTDIHVELVVKVGVLTEEEKSTAEKYNIKVCCKRRNNPNNITMLYVFVVI